MQTTDRDDEKRLIAASAPFAREHRGVSWAHTLGTLLLVIATGWAAATAPWFALRLLAGVVEALMLVRLFVVYHDHVHGALLRDSRVAQAIFRVVGLVMVSPYSIWKKSHNYHHAHNSRLPDDGTGSFVTMTTDDWERATPAEKRAYRVERHPSVVVLGYFTVFIWSLCLRPFVRDSKKGMEGLLSVIVHVGVSLAVALTLGVSAWLTAVFIPCMLGFAFGTLLFYVQHSFEGTTMHTADEWTYGRAALESTSFLDCGPVLHWFTANIGFHHVHHLNPRIPFYRLPEVMAAIPELRNPKRVTLTLRDLAPAFRGKLWDVKLQQLVPFPPEPESMIAPVAHPIPNA